MSSNDWEIFITYSQFKDATNDNNLDACVTKNSKTLGQCILDCNDDSSCETACVATFKAEHSECPCQVSLIHQVVVQEVIDIAEKLGWAASKAKVCFLIYQIIFNENFLNYFVSGYF